jgi:hypothetical protein
MRGVMSQNGSRIKEEGMAFALHERWSFYEYKVNYSIDIKARSLFLFNFGPGLVFHLALLSMRHGEQAL